MAISVAINNACIEESCKREGENESRTTPCIIFPLYIYHLYKMSQNYIYFHIIILDALK